MYRVSNVDLCRINGKQRTEISIVKGAEALPETVAIIKIDVNIEDANMLSGLETIIKRHLTNINKL